MLSLHCEHCNTATHASAILFVIVSIAFTICSLISFCHIDLISYSLSVFCQKFNSDSFDVEVFFTRSLLFLVSHVIYLVMRGTLSHANVIFAKFSKGGCYIFSRDGP